MSQFGKLNESLYDLIVAIRDIGKIIKKITSYMDV